MERAPNGEFPALLHRIPKTETLNDLEEWNLAGDIHSLGESLVPCLSPPSLTLTNRMIGRDSRTGGTTAAGNWIAIGEYAGLRELVQEPPPGTRVNVRDSLPDHGVYGRQTAPPVRIEGCRYLEAKMI